MELFLPPHVCSIRGLAARRFEGNRSRSGEAEVFPMGIAREGIEAGYIGLNSHPKVCPSERVPGACHLRFARSPKELRNA